MKDALPPFLKKGPSSISLLPKLLVDTLPANLFLLPSLVVMSIMEEIRPPYCAPKPPVYMSAFLIKSVSNTENKPME